MTYEELLEAVRKLPPMTEAQKREQRISWTYGNIVLHNPSVTREMCEKIVDEADRERLGPHPQSIHTCDACRGEQGFSYGLGNWCVCTVCRGTGRG